MDLVLIHTFFNSIVIIINNGFLLFFMVGKLNEDFNFIEIYSFFKVNIILLSSIFIIFLILAFFIFLIIPKVYVSESYIQLASIGNDPKTSNIFEPVEAKSIIESGEVLESAVKKYNILLDANKSIKRFREKNLEVEIYKERIGRDELTGNAIIVRVNSKSPEVSMKVNREIVENFMVYSNPYYDAALNVYLLDLEGTISLINKLEKEEDSARVLLNNLGTSSKLDSASDKVLLTQIQSSYRAQLIGLFDRKIRVEGIIANKKDFKILGYPEYPKKISSPSFKIYFFMSFILGILLSVSIAFLREQYKNNIFSRH